MRTCFEGQPFLFLVFTGREKKEQLNEPGAYKVGV